MYSSGPQSVKITYHAAVLLVPIEKVHQPQALWTDDYKLMRVIMSKFTVTNNNNKQYNEYLFKNAFHLLAFS